MSIPKNLSKGRASWTWQKMHAYRFSEEEADFVMANFGPRPPELFREIRWSNEGRPPTYQYYLLRNSAGCYIQNLADDDAPYLHDIKHRAAAPSNPAG